MPQILLNGAAYTSRSVIAAAQRSLNLYPESIPQNQQEPVSVVDLPTPGLTLASVAPQAKCRCLYTTTSGFLVACYGQGIYYIDSNETFHLIGTLVGSASSDAAPRYTPVSMVDSNLYILIADGSIDGWTIALTDANNNALNPLNWVLTRIDSANNTVTGTVSNPTIVGGTTVILQSFGNLYTVTMAATDTNVADVANDIINANIPNITASVNTNAQLVIKNTAGDQIIIGPGTANAALGIADGQYGAADPGGWTGADRVDFGDTYFAFNHPGTPIFGISGSEAITFDSLDFAGKEDKGDPLVTLGFINRNLWLIGTYTTEVWTLSGGGGSGALSVNTFPYEEYPNQIKPFGCIAKYSIAITNNQIFWLAQNNAGQGIVVMGTEMSVGRVSTHAIETAISTYATISDAVGFIYQQQGHVFYQLSFPTADVTWCYDVSTGLWHERSWTDSNGIQHRHRGQCATAAYNKIFVGDWENGNLYIYDLNNYTDNGYPILRLRSFPHQIDPDKNRRINFTQAIANMQVGDASAGSSTQVVVDSSWVAPNGTVLQNYVGTGDIGSYYTVTNPTFSNAAIYSDLVVGVGSQTQYLASGIPLSPDYTMGFPVSPDNYSVVASTEVSCVGRAVAIPISPYVTDFYGYQMKVFGDGTQYYLKLNVQNTAVFDTVALGTLSNGVYDCQMQLDGSLITCTVQRTQDGYWVNNTGNWFPNQATAISLNDTTYTKPGRILIGGDWEANTLNIAVYNISTYNSFAVYA